MTDFTQSFTSYMFLKLGHCRVMTSLSLPQHVFLLYTCSSPKKLTPSWSSENAILRPCLLNFNCVRSVTHRDEHGKGAQRWRRVFIYFLFFCPEVVPTATESLLSFLTQGLLLYPGLAGTHSIAYDAFKLRNPSALDSHMVWSTVHGLYSFLFLFQTVSVGIPVAL